MLKLKKLVLIASLSAIPFVTKGQFWKFSEVKNLSLNKYSKFEKSAPFVFSDGKQILFVKTFDKKNIGGKFDQDIYISNASDSINGLWLLPTNLNVLNNKFNNGVVGLSRDEKKVYLLGSYSDKGDLEKGLSYSKKTNNTWSKPVSVFVPGLKITGENYGFYMHPDEKVLLISYRGEGSYGKEDLYISFNKQNQWSVPVHLPKKVNTSSYEMSPFLSDSKDTLYFSSNRSGGRGGADIYYSIKESEDMLKWSKPKNLGKHINSSRFDAYFFIDSKNTMYWSSNRESKYSQIYSCKPIYYPALSASIKEIKDVTKFGGEDGAITLQIKGGIKPYKISYSFNKEKKHNSRDIDNNGFKLMNCLSGIYSFEIIDSIGQKIILSDTIKEPTVNELVTKINLPQIRHPRDKWTFVQDEYISSMDSLDYLYALLIKYPSLKIELSSHTDARGSENRNQVLSDNRAKACYKYLVEKKGIDPRRIVPIGKGEKEPLKIMDKSQNKLVELNESYINQFYSNKTKFKSLHQLNRRTEVKILNRSFDSKTAKPAPKSYFTYKKLPH
ncbi:MAG: OmpA family protein [Crocinitomicaceae bacterium]|nr:OmpA family protein [Crocinitomicaceae bacterium]